MTALHQAAQKAVEAPEYVGWQFRYVFEDQNDRRSEWGCVLDGPRTFDSGERSYNGHQRGYFFEVRDVYAGPVGGGPPALQQQPEPVALSGFYISGPYPDGNYSICDLASGRVLQLLGMDDFPQPLRDAALRVAQEVPRERIKVGELLLPGISGEEYDEPEVVTRMPVLEQLQERLVRSGGDRVMEIFVELPAAAPSTPARENDADGVPASEVERLRAGQAASVMPQIGPLLDAWDGMDNDTKAVLREEAPDLAEALIAIARAMEGADGVPGTFNDQQEKQR